MADHRAVAATSMTDAVRGFAKLVLGAMRDLAPIILVIGFFEIVILQQTIPNVAEITVGLVCVILGLAFFIQGLEMGLFPLGESMAEQFAKKGVLLWLLLFAFLLGFGTTVAEPALIAVAAEAAEIARLGGAIGDTNDAETFYAFALRMTVALSVGAALVLGVFRILMGWSLPLIIIGGYITVVTLTIFAPPEIVGIAYDSGGVTTSTITVPLVTALGVGLASSIRGRNPMLDGFGLIAFASLSPMIFVLIFGMVI